MSAIEIVDLPWPPSVNRYYRSVNGKVLISAEGRAYREIVAGHVLLQRAAKAFAGRLEVAIHAFPPDKRRRDLDNVQKALLDALTHAGVWGDDEQIDVLSIRRGLVGQGGSVRVAVREVQA